MKSQDSSRVFRIIDANLNRAGEGLRFLEEISRMYLDDTPLTEELKSLRHDLMRTDTFFNAKLLASRDSESDVGIDIEVATDDKEKDLPVLIVANARRVQESLRVLEEISKLEFLASEFESEKFKHGRFTLYTIEKKLMSRLLNQDKNTKNE